VSGWVFAAVALYVVVAVIIVAGNRRSARTRERYPGAGDHPMPPLEFTVHGLPPDDWPGIPGVEWGMGSRVHVTFEVQAADGRRGFGTVEALVVGAVASPFHGWSISVKDRQGEIHSVAPDQVRLAPVTPRG
tara:strand:+ start:8470 stop:8865 length:396 start_codon:yes stop_codon:yes gene_type:complete